MSTCLLRARLSPVITSTMSNATKTVIANLTSSSRMSENLVISEGGTCLTMKLPGYDYSCLTRAGVVSPWRIAKMDENMRMLGILTAGSVLGPIKDQLVFLLGQDISITPASYARSSYFTPVLMESRITHIGRSSAQFNTIAKVAVTGTVLHTSASTVVLASSETRKPIPLSDSIRNATLLKDPPPKLKLEKNDLPSCPVAEVFTETFRATPSEADANLHINHSSFIKYAHDAVSLMVAKGQIQFMAPEVTFPQVKCIKCLYEGEVIPGENVDVKVWHDPDLRHGLRVVIYKEGKPVYHSLMEFIPENTSETLPQNKWGFGQL